MELGPTPGCAACENDHSNHGSERIARFEAAFGKSEEGGSAASAPPPDPESFLSFELFDIPDVVPKADENDVVEKAAADILAGLVPEEYLYEPGLAGDYEDPLADLEEGEAHLPQLLLHLFRGINFRVPSCCRSSAVTRIQCGQSW